MADLDNLRNLIAASQPGDDSDWVGHDRIKKPPPWCIGHQEHLGDNTAEVVDVNYYFANNRAKELQERVWDGRFRDVEKLLKDGVSSNYMDVRQVENGWTPMHTAIMAGHLHMVRLLLVHGAKVDIRNEEGQTAIQTAHGVGREDIVKVLEDVEEQARLKDEYRQIRMNEDSQMFGEKRIILLKNELFKCECGPDKNSFITFCEGVNAGTEKEMDAGAINELLGKTESVSKAAKERKALLKNLEAGAHMR